MNIAAFKRIMFRINKFSTELNYGREIISNWARDLSVEWSNRTVVRLLDVGCGGGQDLLNIKEKLSDKKTELFGIEYQDKNTCNARENGIQIRLLDIERDQIPFEENFFNLVICNQIFEHTKEIFWILSECSRVLELGGYLIVSVPNMVALHNRILLLMGKQPTCLHLVGPHVRGFTIREFKEFLETANVFRVFEIGASNLFPFPPLVGRSLLKFFPGLGISILFLCKRQDSNGNILAAISERNFDTNYMLGA
jgi:2-polyprenyl-3-methyl-5-hydroxy-6-metoxy-1,4-benzoquinol methylase